MKLIPLVAVLSFLASTAFADPANQTVYSKSFYGDGSGLYVNHDPATGCSLMNNCNVALGGPDPLPILVNPWETVSINIVCVQVVFLPTAKLAPTSYAFVGNNYTPDVMVWAVPNENGGATAKMCYPPGTSMAFPAAAPGAPPNGPGQNNFAIPHLDVHTYGGPANTTYQVFLTVWYTKNAAVVAGP